MPLERILPPLFPGAVFVQAAPTGKQGSLVLGVPFEGFERCYSFEVAHQLSSKRQKMKQREAGASRWYFRLMVARWIGNRPGQSSLGLSSSPSAMPSLNSFCA